jgi:hypothetical protein
MGSALRGCVETTHACLRLRSNREWQDGGYREAATTTCLAFDRISCTLKREKCTRRQRNEVFYSAVIEVLKR